MSAAVGSAAGSRSPVAAASGAEFVVVSGGHFLLQEDTARAEALVRRHLA